MTESTVPAVSTIRIDDAGLWLGEDLVIPAPPYLTHSMRWGMANDVPTMTIVVDSMTVAPVQLQAARERLATALDVLVEIQGR